MNTETTTPKTLADFAPDLHLALLSLTHPMASDEDLHDALELLEEIKAARKAASDAAFVAAVKPFDLVEFAERCKGARVWHGSPSYETPEVISAIIEHRENIEIEFESGAFTHLGHSEIKKLARDGHVEFARLGGGSLAGAAEAITFNSWPKIK